MRSAVTEIICAVISSFSAVMVALLSKRIQTENSKIEKRSELRSQESRLILDMIHANIKLSVGTAMAIKNGHCNGELNAGLEAVNSCNEKYNRFLQQIAIDELNK